MDAAPLPVSVVPQQLCAWVLHNKAAGHSSAVLKENLLKAGWSEELAAQAVMIEPATLPGMPDPRVEQVGNRIDVGDAWVDVVFALREPRIVVFANVLSAFECETLIRESSGKLQDSRVVDDENGGERVHVDRSSRGTFFRQGATELIVRIEKRLARLLNWPVENGEDIQILHYAPGAQYKPHYDYFDPALVGSATQLKRGGQRLATLIMYLNQPQQGGATIFPELGLDVLPQRGHAVFFSYERPDPSSKTLHGGAPVIAGEKWIATKWLRQGKFV